MQNNPYRLFEVTGIEAEYMIVDRDTLAVRPIADSLFLDKTGSYVSDYTAGEIEWSNELVNHVIELKTTNPVRSLKGRNADFKKNIAEINSLLEKRNAMLLPTASHPFMNPENETVLWPHEYGEIYRIFDSVFSCKSHGWANLQSVHINLPFQNDDEFGRLHAAVRIVLPLIPAVAASSPFRNGKLTGFLDSRMESYFYHERKIPSLMGRLIPEPVFTEGAYYSEIFSHIVSDFKKYDPDNVMEHHFLNSRGAIARFDRGAIEIRVMDIQESSLADLSIVQAVILAVQNLVREKHISYEDQKKAGTEELLSLFMDSVKTGGAAVSENEFFLSCFGLSGKKAHLNEIWSKIIHDIQSDMDDEYRKCFAAILENGNLSERIIRRMGSDFSQGKIIQIYRELGVCLASDTMFYP